jgi:hypothetical protein
MLRGQNPAGLPVPLAATTEPSPGVEPSCQPYKGWPDPRPEGGAEVPSGQGGRPADALPLAFPSLGWLRAPSTLRPIGRGTARVLGRIRTATTDALNVVPPAVGLRGPSLSADSNRGPRPYEGRALTS